MIIAEMIPHDDNIAAEILDRIKKITDRNSYLLESKDEREVCLEHTHCQCEIIKTRLCHNRICGFFSNSKQTMTVHDSECMYSEDYNEEYNIKADIRKRAAMQTLSAEISLNCSCQFDF